MEQKTKTFWDIYNKYIENPTHELMPRLSELLAEIENKSKRDQLPGSGTIIAWQVLRNQNFIFCRGDSVTEFNLEKGELLVWFGHWDRDLFLNRFPHKEFISGQILHPGYHCEVPRTPDSNRYRIYTDERGLYLPIYKKEVLLKLFLQQNENSKKAMLNYLVKEQVFNAEDIS